jgi:hypothetical protein
LPLGLLPLLEEVLESEIVYSWLSIPDFVKLVECAPQGGVGAMLLNASAAIQLRQGALLPFLR